LHEDNVEIPYNDVNGGRLNQSGRSMDGRLGREENILGAAEEIRSRARRSLR
jgi:hypothetical protein